MKAVIRRLTILEERHAAQRNAQDLRPLMRSGRGSAGDRQWGQAGRTMNCSARPWRSPKLSLKVMLATKRLEAIKVLEGGRPNAPEQRSKPIQ